MLIEAIIGNLVGDYILQVDWMALNKKNHSGVCAIHCAIWTLCVCLFGGLGWVSAIILFATHFAQDRTNLIAWWMDTIGQKQFKTGICSPWSIIVVDNVWHILTIWAVVKFFGGI